MKNVFNQPFSREPVVTPLKNMNTPSIATWIESGNRTVAVEDSNNEVDAI